MRTATRVRLEQQIDEPRRLKNSQQASSTVGFDAAQGAFSSNSKRGISPATLLRMQQTQGNAAVRRMLAQQPQLSIVQRDDDDDDVNQSVAEPQANQSVEPSDSSENDPVDSQPVDQPEVNSSQPDDADNDDTGPVDSQPDNSQPDSSEPNDSEPSDSNNDDTGPADSQPDNSEPNDSDNSDNNDVGPEDDTQGGEFIGDCSIQPEAEQFAAAGKGCSKVNLHGLTTSGYDHGKPRPPKMPSNAITSDVGRNGIKASGTLDVTYTATPKVTLPKVPDACSDCQQAAAQTFINTTLTAHEQEHVKLFKDNYDGSVSLPFDFTVQKNQVVIALTNVMNKEDVVRANRANAASAAIDPFTQPIPGMDCKT